MKRVLSTMCIALGLATAATGARADLLFDNFEDADVGVSDSTNNGSSVSGAWIAISPGNSDIANLERQLTVSKIGGSPSATVSANVADGVLNYSESTGNPAAVGQGFVNYRLIGGGSTNLSGWQTLNLAVTVVAQDLTNPTPEAFFGLRDADGTLLGKSTFLNVGAPHTYVTPFSSFTIFAAGGDGVFDWTQFSSALLAIQGSPAALDVSIDIINTVPEPASLALLGTALAGIGFFARRRKPA